MQRISAQKKKHIESLLKDGMDLNEIAKKAGASAKTVVRAEMYLKYGDDFKAECTQKLPENFETEWEENRQKLLTAFKCGIIKNPIQLTTRG